MNQKQYHQQINQRFYLYVEENFPDYEIDFSEGYGRIYLIPKNEIGTDGIIEYHQSRHDLCCYNWSHQKTKSDIEKMEKYLTENIIPYVNMLKEL